MTVVHELIWLQDIRGLFARDLPPNAHDMVQ